MLDNDALIGEVILRIPRPMQRAVDRIRAEAMTHRYAAVLRLGWSPRRTLVALGCLPDGQPVC